MITLRLGSRELALIIAALRLWQRVGYEHGNHEHAIASNGGDFQALDTTEIDTLCRQLDQAEASRPNVWEDDPDFPSRDWITEVENGDERRGYHDWVAAQKEIAASKDDGVEEGNAA